MPVSHGLKSSTVLASVNILHAFIVILSTWFKQCEQGPFQLVLLLDMLLHLIDAQVNSP